MSEPSSSKLRHPSSARKIRLENLYRVSAGSGPEVLSTTNPLALQLLGALAFACRQGDIAAYLSIEVIIFAGCGSLQLKIEI